MEPGLTCDLLITDQALTLFFIDYQYPIEKLAPYLDPRVFNMFLWPDPRACFLAHASFDNLTYQFICMISLIDNYLTR